MDKDRDIRQICTWILVQDKEDRLAGPRRARQSIGWRGPAHQVGEWGVAPFGQSVSRAPSSATLGPREEKKHCSSRQATTSMWEAKLSAPVRSSILRSAPAAMGNVVLTALPG